MKFEKKVQVIRNPVNSDLMKAYKLNRLSSYLAGLVGSFPITSDIHSYIILVYKRLVSSLQVLGSQQDQRSPVTEPGSNGKASAQPCIH